jgi:hypothetical protein
MNGVTVEQVEETKLLGVILDFKLPWSKHTDSMVVKMGRGLSVMATLHKANPAEQSNTSTCSS